MVQNHAFSYCPIHPRRDFRPCGAGGRAGLTTAIKNHRRLGKLVLATQKRMEIYIHRRARLGGGWAGAQGPHPTNQRGTSPNRPFQNGGGGAPRKATPAQNGPTHPRTQRNFSVCLKQIAAIKIANAMAAEYSRAQEISLICQACSSSPASGHPADVRRGPRR